VEAGPLVRIRVAGASLSEGKLRQLLPVYRDGVIDNEAVSRGEQILEDYFQRQGYVHASVKADQVDDSGRQRIEITFQASLGTQEEFAGYGFQGNHSVPEAELATAIAEGPNGSSSMRRVFSQELLARHVDTLRAVYQARGFLEARVAPRLQEQTEYQPPRLFVTFEIVEGLRAKVHSLVLQGVDREVENKIWPLLLTKPGEPYSPERAQADRDSILSYLANQGYTHSSASWQASPISPAHETDLVYQIDRGPQERIKRVVVMGQRHTREGVIRRQLALREGEPLRQSDLAESQRRLYDLGIFNQVQITKQDTQSPETEQTVLVDLEEARRWTLGYGGGIEMQQLGSNQPQGQLKASPRLSLEVTRLNVGGRAQTFSIHGQLSNLERGGGLSYLIPHLLNRPDWTLRLNGLVDRSRDVLTFTADRREGSVSIEKRLSPTGLILGRYAFRRVQALDISTRIRPEQIPLFSRPARVGALGTSFVNDRRDDPADATEGSYSVADAAVAWRDFGSEADFLRFSVQNSTFRSLRSHLILARSTRFGVESPFGHVNLALVPSIPLPERFFMGGSESHRGFSINQAGPRDPLTGYPLGGNALFFNSFELRAPFKEKRLGLVLFHDAGNVFSTIRKMRLLKFIQNSPTDLDYDVQAVGLGIRYKTPVAPVRFDVGYDLNPPRFQAQVQPNPNLAPILEVRRLSRFQFFLSVGQSF
jgi:outer membrane protein assembly complex protein YaeT